MNDRKWIAYFLTVFLLGSVCFRPWDVQAAPGVSAHSAILMDQETGRVLYEKNAEQQMKIASITKIMTAIVAIESGDLQDTVTVSSNAAGTEGSSLYLVAGQKMKLEDLLYGLMLRSGNDSAVAIAEHVGGSLEGFVYLMNQKAEEIGMENTNFDNPHGLDDSDTHLSTSYDMALLMKYSMNNETFQEISSTEVHKAHNPNGDWDYSWHNKNRLLTQLYEYCTGGKTGYTKLAKRTLVTTAEKDGEKLIAVTLNGPDDWNDHISMYEYGFDQFDYYVLAKKGSLSEIKDSYYKGKVYIKHEIKYSIKELEKEKIRIHYQMNKPTEKLQANPPEIVGRAIVEIEKKELFSVPIYFETASVKEDDPWWKIWKKLFFITIGVSSNG
ncbi:D-alanyl-D-alanine carboxypeptidase [Bacillus coahuilensis m2-6]|uniref:D-alanyl-D-alanine carboxypeptidase family protein n=1 Tax=Bacillus coahuilensis TaxID=408580 RepID=UPI0007504CF8|nr:D-alanyl-D-alanine carboxypeptidase family protein [Bacillus coahuilensis]KUP07824.1 D-alanyl-D-alanine carboxypeptidase [Bacillus coahuilensis m2-6]